MVSIVVSNCKYICSALIDQNIWKVYLKVQMEKTELFKTHPMHKSYLLSIPEYYLIPFNFNFKLYKITPAYIKGSSSICLPVE